MNAEKVNAVEAVTDLAKQREGRLNGDAKKLLAMWPDMQKAYQTVVERGAPADKAKPKIGRNGKWQLNLYDPDGSRTELMESHPAQQKEAPDGPVRVLKK